MQPFKMRFWQIRHLRWRQPLCGFWLERKLLHTYWPAAPPPPPHASLGGAANQFVLPQWRLDVHSSIVGSIDKTHSYDINVHQNIHIHMYTTQICMYMVLCVCKHDFHDMYIWLCMDRVKEKVAYIYMYIYIYMCIYMCTYIYIYMCVCMCVFRLLCS